VSKSAKGVFPLTAHSTASWGRHRGHAGLAPVPGRLHRCRTDLSTGAKRHLRRQPPHPNSTGAGLWSRCHGMPSGAMGWPAVPGECSGAVGGRCSGAHSQAPVLTPQLTYVSVPAGSDLRPPLIHFIHSVVTQKKKSTDSRRKTGWMGGGGGLHSSSEPLEVAESTSSPLLSSLTSSSESDSSPLGSTAGRERSTSRSTGCGGLGSSCQQQQPTTNSTATLTLLLVFIAFDELVNSQVVPSLVEVWGQEGLVFDGLDADDLVLVR